MDWEREKAISRESKVIAIIMLMVSWGILFWKSDNAWLVAGLAVFFVGAGTFLITRPEPKHLDSEKTNT